VKHPYRNPQIAPIDADVEDAEYKLPSVATLAASPDEVLVVGGAHSAFICDICGVGT
jgi:hypothetical protein